MVFLGSMVSKNCAIIRSALVFVCCFVVVICRLYVSTSIRHSLNVENLFLSIKNVSTLEQSKNKEPSRSIYEGKAVNRRRK